MAKRIKIYFPDGNNELEIFDDQLDNYLAKGFKKDKNNKLKFEDFEKLCGAYAKQKFLERKYVNKTESARKKLIKNAIKDELITQQQVQFVSPLYYHMSENLGYSIEKREVEKWFRIGYTKGVIGSAGWVKPLIY